MNPSSEELNSNLSTSLSDKSKAIGKRKAKAIKDPLAPKRPLSAFFQFSQEQRPVVMAELGNISVAEVGKELGKRWAALEKETKSKYENMVVEAKARYEEEMKTYQPSQEFLEKRAVHNRKNEQKASKLASQYFSFVDQNWRKVAFEYNLTEKDKLQEKLWKTWNDENGKVVKKKGQKQINNNHAPVERNPQTAFCIFQKEMKEKLERVAGRTISDTELSGLVGEKWNTLDQKLKIEYEKWAEVANSDK